MSALCESCAHNREGACDLGYLDSTLCGGWYEPLQPEGDERI